jgi:hypothetical protein
MINNDRQNQSSLQHFNSQSNTLNSHNKKSSKTSLNLFKEKVQEGHDPANFTTPVNSDLLCPICNFVVRKPRECIICGNMFCEYCIKTWAEKMNKISTIHNISNVSLNTQLNSSRISLNIENNYIIQECPMKCKSNYNIRESIVKPIGKVVKNILYQMEIKCPNSSCGKAFLLDKYEDHEFYCFLPKCDNLICKMGSDKQICVSFINLSLKI